MPLQAYANYAMGSPQVGFFFRVEPPTVLYITSLVSVLVSAFYFQVHCWMPYSPLGAQPFEFAPLQPLEFTHGRHMCNLVMVISPHQVWHRVAAPSTTLSGGALCYSVCCSQPSHLYGGAYSFGGLAESHLIPLPSLNGGEGSSFPGLVPSSNIIDSEFVIGIKPGDSGVVIGYQVDEYSHVVCRAVCGSFPHLSWVHW